MLSSLSTPLESGLELSLSRRDDENGDIGLSRTGDHRWDKGLVAGSIQDGVPPLVRLEVGSSDLDSLSLATLLWGRIERPGQVPRLSTCFLCFFLVLLESSLILRDDTLRSAICFTVKVCTCSAGKKRLHVRPYRTQREHGRPWWIFQHCKGMELSGDFRFVLELMAL